MALALARDASASTALLASAAVGDTRGVLAALDAGADVDSMSEDGYTALYLASGSGYCRVVRALLQRGASVTATGSELGVLPIHAAAVLNQLDVLNILLDSGADVNTPAGDGSSSPLYLAITVGAARIVRQLLRRGARFTSSHPLRGRDELHHAATVTRGDPAAVVAALCEAGCSVHTKSVSGYTAAHVATHCGAVQALRGLLAAGADVNVRDDRGVTPLLISARVEALDCMRVLLNAGADPNGRDNEGSAPMHFAGCHDTAAVAEALRAAGANVNVRTTNGLSPLHTAAMSNAATVVTALIRMGADPNLREDRYGDTPLHIAAGRSAVQCVSALLAGGADLFARNTMGLTPAGEALCTGGSDAVFHALCSSRRELAAVWRCALDAAGIDLGRSGGLVEGALPVAVADDLQRRAIRALAAASTQQPPVPLRLSGIRGVLRGARLLRAAPTAPPPPLPDAAACMICCSAPRDVRLTACGHAAACASCFTEIAYGRASTPMRSGARCPLCRAPVPPGAFAVATLPDAIDPAAARPRKRRRRGDAEAEAGAETQTQTDAGAAAEASLLAAVGPEFDATAVVPEHKEQADMLTALGVEVIYS